MPTAIERRDGQAVEDGTVAHPSKFQPASAIFADVQIIRSQASNSLLRAGPTTPQDYPERSGFGRRREREWGHGGTAAGSVRSTHSCAFTLSATTGSRC